MNESNPPIFTDRDTWLFRHDTHRYERAGSESALVAFRRTMLGETWDEITSSIFKTIFFGSVMALLWLLATAPTGPDETGSGTLGAIKTWILDLLVGFMTSLPGSSL